MLKKLSKKTALIIISLFTLIFIILLLFTIERTTGFADKIFQSKNSELSDFKSTEPEVIANPIIETKKEEYKQLKKPTINNRDIPGSFMQRDNYLNRTLNIKINDYDTINSLDSKTKMNTAKLEKPEKYFNGYIIKLKETPILIKQKELKEQKLADSTIAKQLEEYKMELRFKEESVISEVSKILNKNSKEIITKEFSGNIISGFVLNISETDAEKLKNINKIDISPNYYVQVNLMESVSIIKAKNLWNCPPVDPRSGANQAIPANNYPCLTGEGIKIAIVDTGVDYTHPDLGGCLGPDCKVIGGYDFVNDDTDPIDDMGHGTHCAAIAAGNGVLKGVAPNAKILAYKVLSSGGSGYLDDIISGIEQAVIDGADIINLSLGGPGNPDDFISVVVDNAVDLGVVVVVAAGNSGSLENTVRSPGTARKAITVGATDKQDNMTWFSSRGPVIWNGGQNILMKPDLVAPGASICAAQHDEWLDQYSCLNDGQHIAIDGTSMAAPHVAGAAALLKQKYPNLNPEEIKQLLKNGADDVWNDPEESYVTEHGAGRLNIFNSVKLGGNVSIAKLSIENNNISGIIDITGTATGNYFQRYVVYYKPGDLLQDRWMPICDNNQPIIDDVLCNNFDTYNLNDKDVYFKLVVYNSDETFSKDISINKINNFEITDFGLNNYIKRKEQIKGFINTPNYTAYKLEFNTEENLDWQELCNISGTISDDGIICDFDFQNLENGEYNFRLSILKNNVWLKDDEIEKGLINELTNNSPIFLNCETLRNTYVKNNNEQKYILNKFKYCFHNWIWGRELLLFNNDFMYENLSQITSADGTNYFFETNGKIAFSDKQLIFNADNYTDHLFLNYVGYTDMQGNISGNWPIESNLMYGSDNSPLVIGDNVFLLKYKITSALENDETIYYRSLYLFGYNNKGELLSNYPIEIGTINWNTSSIYAIKLGLIKENNQNKIGLSYLIYHTDNGGINYSNKLFFNVYSEDGELINNNLIKELNNRDFWSYDFASADFDGDESTEIAIAISDFEWYGDANDLETYHSYLIVLNCNGEVISEPFEIYGYLINNHISIGKFHEDSYPKIIFSLFATYATSGSPNLIKVIDYRGNEYLNIETYNRIGPASIADITADGRNEIILGYHPKQWPGENSGILIYNGAGDLVQEIVIPILGTTEYLHAHYYPILTDLDNDSRLDVVLQTTSLPKNYRTNPWDTHLFVLQTNHHYNPDAIDWTQDAYNERNTSCYKCD